MSTETVKQENPNWLIVAALTGFVIVILAFMAFQAGALFSKVDQTHNDLKEIKSTVKGIELTTDEIKHELRELNVKLDNLAMPVETVEKSSSIEQKHK